MSAVLAIAQPRRIKATHRRRRKITAGPIVQRYYDPAIGRFLSSDPAESAFNRYSYASNNPYKFTDPDGRQSCKTNGNTMTCDPEVKGMPTITIPKPVGFPSRLDGSQKNAHQYDKQKSAGPGTAGKTKAIQQAIVKDPTPGADQPATPTGTINNATPTSGFRSLAPIDSPVISYSATAPSGNTIVINVTLPGHPLHPGVVMRGAVSEGGEAVVHNAGVGTGVLQSNADFGDAMFNNVWYEQSQNNIDASK